MIPLVDMIMKIINSSRAELIEYTVGQIAAFFPDGKKAIVNDAIERHIDEALARLAICINSVKTWEPDNFNYLHSSQYCTYLYFLANTIWRSSKEVDVPTRIFLLNKLLNGIDLFYEIEMPDIFFIGHSTGIVLAKAKYSNYFVIYQNSTVGKNHGIAPELGEGVIMYPNSSIIGRSLVGDHSVIAQGVGVMNTPIPGDCMVFSDGSRELVLKPLKRKLIEDFFRF